MSEEPAGLLIARVTVERRLHEDGSDIVWSDAHDGNGDALALIETLGMLEMAKDTAIRLAMGEGPDDDDSDT